MLAFGRAINSDTCFGSFLIVIDHLLELPPETEVLEIIPSGESAWVQTVRIRTRQKDGTSKDYFKKVHRVIYNGIPYSNVVVRAKAAAWAKE